MLEILGNRNITLAREISKIHEEFIRGKIEEILEKTQDIKGEYVIIVEGTSKKHEKKEFLNTLSLEEHYNYYLNQKMDNKEIIKRIAKDRDTNKNVIYQYFLKNKNK